MSEKERIPRVESMDERISGEAEVSEGDMSDEEFNGWLTMGSSFSDKSSRKDETMLNMLIMTKISQSELTDEAKQKYEKDIEELIKSNMDKLVGKQYKVVHVNNTIDKSKILFTKGKIALVSE